MIERALQTFLRNDDDIRDIVGQNVYAWNLPQGVKGPCILLTQISTLERYYSNVNEVDLVAAVVQIDMYEDRPSSVRRLAEHVRNRLSGYYGGIEHLSDDGGLTTTTVATCKILRDQPLAELPLDSSDKWRYRYSADYLIHHSQSVPSHA